MSKPKQKKPVHHSTVQRKPVLPPSPKKQALPLAKTAPIKHIPSVKQKSLRPATPARTQQANPFVPAPAAQKSVPTQKPAQHVAAPPATSPVQAFPSTQQKESATDALEIKNEVESLLFSSGKAMSEESLVNLTHREPSVVKKALRALQQEYTARNGALALYEDTTVWRLNVREKYVKLVRKIIADVEFNKSLLKTLATIAWKSPVLQSEIIRIRSTKGYDHIDELEQAGFIQRERKGRSYVLKTTQKFSDYFDIDQAAVKKAFQNVKAPEQTTLAALQPAPVPQDGLPTTIKGENIIDHEFLEQIEQKLQAAAKRSQDKEEIPAEKKENTQ